MSIIVEQDSVAKLLKGFHIPPRPDVLVRFQEERSKPNPNLQAISEIVSSDPGLSAGVIKTINSPFFGLRRKISSIQEAITILGLINLDNILTSLALVTAIGNKVPMDRFWDTAIDVALISRDLSRHITGVLENDAFTIGMFHDCGIALMMQRIPDYKAFLKKANADITHSLAQLEQEHYQTDHTTVGFLVANTWNLPEHINQAIQLHHDHRIFSALPRPPENVLTHVAILKIATYLSHINRKLQDGNDWMFMRPAVLDYLGISAEEFGEIESDVRDNAYTTPAMWVSKFA